MARIKALTIAMSIGLLPLAAQMIVQPSGKSVPQAATREELDAFGLVLEAGSSEAILIAAIRYRERFPKSEFFEYACVAEMQAAMELARLPVAEEAAHTVLNINSNNPEALLTLAEIGAAGLRRDSDKTRVESTRQFAQRALDRLRTFPAPAFSDPAAWLNTKRAMEARAGRVLAQLAATATVK